MLECAHYCISNENEKETEQEKEKEESSTLKFPIFCRRMNIISILN